MGQYLPPTYCVPDLVKRTLCHTSVTVVPTTFDMVYEEEWAERNVNIVIYANHLVRAAFPAMRNTAETILKNGRCKEANEQILPIKEVLTLIPEQ